MRDQRRGYDQDVDYRLTDPGRAFLLSDLGVIRTGRRPVVRYCIDWSEQRHHLSGAVGRGILDRLVELDWIRRTPGSRAVHLTPGGRAGFSDAFDLEL